MNKLIIIFISFFLTLNHSLVLAKNTPNPDSRPVAKMDNRTITEAEFNQKYSENLKHFPVNPPSKQAVLDDLVKRELGILEAKNLKLDQDPEIQEKIKTVLFHALIEKQVLPRLNTTNLTDQKLKEYYEKNPIIRTSHIFISVPQSTSASTSTPNAEKKALEKINKIYTDYLKPGKMNFIEAAQKFSEGPTAALGGDLDFQPKSKLDPIYYDAALKIGKIGGISSVIRTKYGFHIIQFNGKRPWKEVDPNLVRRMALDEERSRVFDAYMDNLKKKYNVKMQL